MRRGLTQYLGLEAEHPLSGFSGIAVEVSCNFVTDEHSIRVCRRIGTSDKFESRLFDPDELTFGDRKVRVELA